MKVDKFGNIIGGVNPFEGTDVKLEDQPKPDDDEEVGSTCVVLLGLTLRSHPRCRWQPQGFGGFILLLVPALIRKRCCAIRWMKV